jgi:hypothetical protein
MEVGGMRIAIGSATIVFLTASIIFPIVKPQSDPDAACRQRLENLAAAVTAYQVIHDGRKPGKLSDLYSEGLISSLSDFMIPGSEAALRTRADIDAQTGFTLAEPGDAPNVLVREKAPRAGRDTILAATADGKTLAIGAGTSNPIKPSAPAAAGAPSRSSGFQIGATRTEPAAGDRTPSPSGFQIGATQAGPAGSAPKVPPQAGFQIGATQAAPARQLPAGGSPASGDISSLMRASLLGTWVADGFLPGGPPYRCMVAFGDDAAFSSGVWVDGKMVEWTNGVYRLENGRLILLPEGRTPSDANVGMKNGILHLTLPNFSERLSLVRQQKPGGN